MFFVLLNKKYIQTQSTFFSFICFCLSVCLSVVVSSIVFPVFYIRYILDIAQAPHSMLTGDKILWESSQEGATKAETFSIKLKLTNITTNTGSCAYYPNSEHLTYAACIDSHMKKKSFTAFGCNVPWMTTDDQCSGQIKKLAKHKYAKTFLEYIIIRSRAGLNYHPRECSLPCSLVSAHSTRTQSENWEHDSLLIYLDETVTIERIVLAYSFTDLLVEVKYCI